MLFQQYNFVPGTNINFDLLANLGRIDGVHPIFVFGHNTDIDSGTTPEDVWETGGLYPFQTTAVNCDVVSTSVNDSSSGTGLRTLMVQGLDSSFNQISEIVALNGTTPVDLQNQYIRINFLSAITGGSLQTNDGQITIAVKGGATDNQVMSAIMPDHGQSHQAIYTVPNNKKIVITGLQAFIRRSSGTENAEVALMTRQHGSNFWVNTFHINGTTTGSSLSIINSNPAMVVLPEKTDIRLTCTYTSATNVSLLAMFQGYQIDNSDGE